VNKLAIVIPYFKSDKFEETLSSLDNQTNQNFNIYIGDDASSHSPDSIIDKFDFFNRLVYHRFNENLGKRSLTSQWERCLKIVTGGETWIMILCDDDVLSQNCVSEFYFNINKVNKIGSNVIRFASRVINGDGVYISEKYIHPEIENPLDFIFRKEQGGTRSSLSEYVFKATELKTYRFVDFPLGWHSDVVAVLELSQKTNIFTINSSSVNFRIFENSITGSPKQLKAKAKATISYYVYLIRNYGLKMSRDQIIHYKRRVFKIWKENKRDLFFWFQLFRSQVI
jgi:glycosyltransferase involved in cell wall biosynthesis